MKAICTGLAVCAIMYLTLSSCGFPKDSGSARTNLNPPTDTAPPYQPVRPSEFHGEKNFAFLINTYPEGKAVPTPWAGFWWPYLQNGIASGEYDRGQSPAGKYDAARGRKTHAQDWEIQKHGSKDPKVQGWWGHCNGWCIAAALFPEPREAVKVNGINFSIGDIKALLTEVGMNSSADFFGERIDSDDITSPKFWDTVPDQYFLVLTNYLGKLKKTVLIDRYTGHQVWNQPLAGYRFDYPRPSDYLGNSPEAPHIYRIMVRSTLWWANDGVLPDTLTRPFNFEEDEDLNGIFSYRKLVMEVWVDAPIVFDEFGKIKSSGNVIVTRQGEYLAGGAWRMGELDLANAWPDYMWVPYSVIKPTDPAQEYVNPEIDLDWIKAHLLVPGGADDPSVTPSPVVPPPVAAPPPSIPASPLPAPSPTLVPAPPSSPSPRP